MANKIFLFTGEERFLLQQELRRWTDAFVQKHGLEGLFVIRSDAFDLATIKQSLGWGWLFSSSKMVVIYGVPTDGSPENKLPAASIEWFADFVMSPGFQLAPETILVLVSYKPDKRTKMYKYLEKEATIKSFEKQNFAQLKWYVQQWTPGLVWDDLTLTYFFEKVWSDLNHIQLETEKLAVYAKLHNLSQITSEQIDLVSFGVLDTNSFAFFDDLLVDKYKALRVLQDAQEQGIHWTMFAWSLYRWLKLWVFLLDMDTQWISDPKVITSTIKYSPFAVSKALKHIKSLRRYDSQIKDMYRRLVDLDEGIKTGKVSDSLFWISLKKCVLESF